MKQIIVFGFESDAGTEGFQFIVDPTGSKIDESLLECFCAFLRRALDQLKNPKDVDWEAQRGISVPVVTEHE